MQQNVEQLTERLKASLHAMQRARQLIGYADAFHAPEVIAELEDAIAKTKEALAEK